MDEPLTWRCDGRGWWRARPPLLSWAPSFSGRRSARSSCPSSTKASSGSGRTYPRASPSRSPRRSRGRFAGSFASRRRSRPSPRRLAATIPARIPSGPTAMSSSWTCTPTIPGASFNFTQPIIDTATEIVTGSSADLAVIISGPDLKELRSLAQQTRTLLAQIKGAADTSIEQESDQAQLRITIDRAQVARYGLNVADVQDVIDLALGGAPIGGVFEGERR